MEHRGLIWLMAARHGGPTDDPAVGRLAVHGVLEAMEPPELALLCETDRRLFDLIRERPRVWSRMEEGMKRLIDEELCPIPGSNSGYVRRLSSYLYKRARVMKNIEEILPDQSKLPSVAQYLSLERADADSLDRLIRLDESIALIRKENVTNASPKRERLSKGDPFCGPRVERRKTVDGRGPKRSRRNPRSDEPSLWKLQKDRRAAGRTRATFLRRVLTVNRRSRDLKRLAGVILDGLDGSSPSFRP